MSTGSYPPGRTPKSLANLIPAKEGEVRNPTGRNQYSGRIEFEAVIDALLQEVDEETGKTRAQLIAEKILEMAAGGDSRLLEEVLARLWPVTEKVEVSGTESSAVEIDQQVVMDGLLQKLEVLSRTARYRKAEGRATDGQTQADVK